MSVVNKFIDSENFATAISVYDDVNLLIKSPDGFYQFNGIYREQVGGFLSPEIICPACALPCGEIAGESRDIRGTFLAEISGGTGVGAVVVYSITGFTKPDGVLSTYNGQTYNQLTYIGNVGGPVGLNTPSGEPTYYGQPGQTPSTTPPILVYNIQTDGTYASSGTSQAITVNSNQIDLRGGGTRVYTQVIPKNIVSASVINIDYYAPIQDTFFTFQTDCPIQLDSFLGSSVQADDTCGAATINYYFAQNAQNVSGPPYVFPIVFTPETLATPGIGNYVFLDDGGVTAINNTATSQFVILADSTYIEIQYGIVIATGTCTPAGLPCGGTLTPPPGSRGVYQLDIDAGTTALDTGAILVYFNPASIPDGIRVLYDGVFYNRLSSASDGNLQSTSGVANAFTILGDPTDNCVPATPNTGVYNAFNGYDSNGWIADTPSTRSITINTGDDIRGGQSQFNLMVIPKPNASPGTVSIEVLGPCASTGWNLSVECPAALPSFTANAIGSSTFCQPVTGTFFFARFQNAVNVYPVLNNPIFLDHDGVTRATDQNYLMDNGQYITVTNGVVSNIQTCTPPI
jgi:hypothetical protein|tara:strand:- start:14996 stop:16714 length:1719 start_codon:yes stop_codon:yes gene_type:complete